MSISYVSSLAVEANTMTFPSHAANDLIVVCGFRTTSGAVTVPSSLNYIRLSVSKPSANTAGSVLVMLRADSASMTCGTFTGAEMLIAGVWRPTTHYLTIADAASNGNSSTTTSNFAAAIGRDIDGTDRSWYGGIIAAKHQTVDINTAPAGMTNRTSAAGATAVARIALHDTNAVATSWSATNRTMDQTVAYHSYVFEIAETTLPIASSGGVPRFGIAGAGPSLRGLGA